MHILQGWMWPHHCTWFDKVPLRLDIHFQLFRFFSKVVRSAQYGRIVEADFDWIGSITTDVINIVFVFPLLLIWSKEWSRQMHQKKVADRQGSSSTLEEERIWVSVKPAVGTALSRASHSFDEFGHFYTHTWEREVDRFSAESTPAFHHSSTCPKKSSRSR